MVKKKTLAELKAEKKEADEKYYAELKETMNEEFHSVWEEMIKPAPVSYTHLRAHET